MSSNGFEVENRSDALALARQARTASGDMLSPGPEEQSLAGAGLRCSASIDEREAAAFTLSAAEQFLLLDNEGMLLEWGELRPAVRRALLATSVGTELAPVLR